MSARKMPTIIRVAVAVMVVAGAISVTRGVLGCSPPRDQADMIELYEADPLLTVVPHGGQLIDEHAHSYTCDSGMRHGGSPTSPGFAEVMRLYRTSGPHSAGQLRQVFDQPAVAAGWRIVPEPSSVGYCKQTGDRASYARVSSRIDGRAAPGVEVTLGAGPDGSTCADMSRRLADPVG